MYYRTCAGCRLAKSECSHRSYLRDTLAGMGITSIKFACALRKPLFEPGDPVSIWLISHERGDGHIDIASEECEATVIRCIGTKVMAYVHPNEDTDYILKNENRYVKVAAQHVRKRDGERLKVCKDCDGIEGINAHVYGYRCNPAGGW